MPLMSLFIAVFATGANQNLTPPIPQVCGAYLDIEANLLTFRLKYLVNSFFDY